MAERIPSGVARLRVRVAASVLLWRDLIRPLPADNRDRRQSMPRDGQRQLRYEELAFHMEDSGSFRRLSGCRWGGRRRTAKRCATDLQYSRGKDDGAALSQTDRRH
jgi:hypothetical protein